MLAEREKRSGQRRALRWLLLLAGLVLVWVVGRPALFLAWVASNDARVVQRVPAGYADDASGLELTAVEEVWPVPADREAAIEGLRSLLARAHEKGLPVSIAGARHSMGGHTIAPDGIVIDMTGFDAMRLDEESGLLRVGSGAVWTDVLHYLDPLGYSVAVMQSNSSFTVGGSLSVDCHGWQPGRPPIAATVRAFRILLADGRLLECTRESNGELFALALGGYGLFGILIDADLEVARNELYEGTTTVLDSAELGARFLERAGKPDVGLALARLSVSPDSLFEESLLRVFARVESPGGLPPITPSTDRELRRAIFRGSVGSDYGKRLRWMLEKRFGQLFAGGSTTRNSELCEEVDVYANDDSEGTDILHEYFVPQAALAEFLHSARPVIESSSCDLLNVTVRDVREDTDTFLRYADQDVFGLVMLFHQKRTARAEEEMRALTQDLIDVALSVGGRYYLPYRLHASRAQFEQAYPMAEEFFEAKRRYDPDELFQNRFYLAYGR